MERIFEHLYGYIKQHYAADNTETSKRKEEIKKKKAETKKKIEAIYNKKKFKDSGFVVLFGEAILRKNFAQRMLKTIADDKTKNNFKTLWKQYETLSDELFEADTKRTSFMDTLEAVREGIELIEENGMTMGVRKFDTIEGEKEYYTEDLSVVCPGLFLVHPQQFLNDFKGRSKVWPKTDEEILKKLLKKNPLDEGVPGQDDSTSGSETETDLEDSEEEGLVTTLEGGEDDDEDSDFDPDEHRKATARTKKITTAFMTTMLPKATTI